MILCTATQPTLPNLRAATEIIPNPHRLYKRLKRTNITTPCNINERRSWEEVAIELQEHPQVLCIVNTRRNCRELFELMPSGTIHLSALMCGQHRSKIIELIKNQLNSGGEIRVISTQLVEAGVDIDFPVVYRALAGLDSITQSAGRCNREGKLNADGKLGEVHIFVPPTSAPKGMLLKGEQTSRELFSLDGFNPESLESCTQ